MRILNNRRIVFLAALIIILLWTPYLIPISRYIRDIEEVASKELQRPVNIQSIRAGSLPIPYILLEGVVIGNEQPIKIGSLKVTIIDFLSFIYGAKKIHSLVFADVDISQEALNYSLVLLKLNFDKPQKIVVNQIQIRNLSLITKKSLGSFDANISLSNEGKLEDISIHSGDNKLSVFIKPLEENFSLNIEADHWINPIGVPITFDRLSMRGIITKTNLSFTGISGQLYGGSVYGNAELSWQNSYQLKGQLRGQKIEVGSLLKLFNSHTAMSGKLDLQTQFSMAARTLDRLADNAALNGQFNVHNGELKNFDLAKAVKTFTKAGIRGGTTRFDEFTGTIKMANKNIDLTQLKISSGVLAADGEISIAPNNNLSGDLSVALKGSAKLVSIPLTVKGTMNDPLLKLSNSALAGAAAGTAVLGPGVGTSIGVKLGEFFNKLFKKKKDATGQIPAEPWPATN